MEDKKKMLLADCALILAAICWGGGYVAGDIAVGYFTPFVILAVRFLMAALVVFLLFRRVIRRSGMAEIKAGAILGVLLFIAHPIQVIALKYTTPSKQAFLVATYAAIVPFLSWIILKKRPKGKSFLAGILTLVGIGLISLDGAMHMGLGDALSLCFALLYSLKLVITGVYVTKCEPISMSFFSFLVTGVLSLFVAVFFEGMPEAFPARGVGALVQLALVTTGVAYTLQNVAQRYTSDTHTAILLSTDSIFGFLFGVLLYGDPFTMRLLIGGMIVFSAVLVSELGGRKKLITEAPPLEQGEAEQEFVTETVP